MNGYSSFKASIFLLFFCAAALAQNPAANVTVDANIGRHPIDPRVYGIAYGTTAQLSDLNVPLNRYGGNNTSRYNWQLNADNRGQDWYFESIGDSSGVPGERGDNFISLTQAAGARAMITIPMLDWVARLGLNRSKLAGFSQAKYGAQTGNDAQWFPDAGNGILKSTNQPVPNNDPNDANVGNTSLSQQQWVQAIVNRWGLATSAGPRYYVLDNEPSIWHSTHRDVHPVGATMDEVLSRIKDYAAQIRAADPNAIIAGPEEWGWSGYFYSGYDQQYGSQHGWSFLPDRANHGGANYLPWMLGQLKADGRHLLDVFTVHYYPQGGEFSNDTSTSMLAPLTVNFSSVGSNDPDGSIASYRWDFGDGSTASTNASPTHVYPNAGNYTAVLTVTDNRGATGTSQVAIAVSLDPSVINAPSNLTASGGKNSATLKWTDNSTNETVFYIERAASGSTNFARVGSVAANVKTFTDPVSRGVYTYRAQAFNTAGLSAYSNNVSVRVK